jgi:hypothetical protein
LSKLAKALKPKPKIVDDAAVLEGGVCVDVAGDALGDEAAGKVKKKARPPNAEMWKRFYFGDDGAYLCYDQKANSICAHCPYHGTGCRANKALNKAPMGFLLHWIYMGSRMKDSTMAEHCREKDASRAEESYAGRYRARDFWSSDPKLAQPFLLEAMALFDVIENVTEPLKVK